MAISAFISYRRAPAAFIARAMYQDLRAHHFDAFLDVQSIDSGAFTSIIEQQIRNRDYFIIILTPDTLNRCQQVDDLVRREIQIAFDSQRTIIPFVMETFDWEDIKRYLPPELQELAQMNSVPKVSHEWFEAAMDRLRTRHLKPLVVTEDKRASADNEAVAVPSAAPSGIPVPLPPPPAPLPRPITPLPEAPRHSQAPQLEASDEEVAFGSSAYPTEPYYLDVDALPVLQSPVLDAASLPPVTLEQMQAEARVQQAVVLRQAERYAEARTLLDQVIADLPEYASARLQRGLVLLAQNDHAASIPDFERALVLSPSADAWGGKVMALLALGELARAVFDLTYGLNQYPDDAGLLFLRAHLHQQSGQLKEAVADMERVLSLNPDYPSAHDTLTEWKQSRGWRGWFA